MVDRTTRQRLWRRGLSAGIVTGLLVLGAGAAWSFTYQPSYTATATLLVLPDAKSAQSRDAASYYDTLSQGQIVQTFAQVLRAKAGPVWPATGQIADTTVSVTAVPSTSIISLTTQGTDPATAEHAAEALAAWSPHELNGLATPYRALTVDTGAGSAQKSGFDLPELLAAVVAVAVLAGVGAQQVVWLLGNASLRAAGNDRRAGFGYDTVGFPIVGNDEEAEPGRRSAARMPAPENGGPRTAKPPVASTRRVLPAPNGAGGARPGGTGSGKARPAGTGSPDTGSPDTGSPGTVADGAGLDDTGLKTPDGPRLPDRTYLNG